MLKIMPYVKNEVEFTGSALEDIPDERVTYGAGGGRASRLKQEILFRCCVPTGCTRSTEVPVRWMSDPPRDAVRIACSNRSCYIGQEQWMHWCCFQEWERLISAVWLASTGRRLSWTERSAGGKQRDSFSWMGNPVCDDIVMKVRGCICGNGFLRRDVEYEAIGAALDDALLLKNAPPPSLQKLPNHHQQHRCRRGQEEKTAYSYSAAGLSFGSGTVHTGDGMLPGTVFWESQLPLRVRTFSFSSTGSSTTSSNATPPPMSSPRRAGDGVPSSPSSLTTLPQSPIYSPEATATTSGSDGACLLGAGAGGGGGASGNIFKHRKDLGAFRVLPRSVQNPYHIKTEDDGPHGNDKVRNFLMTSLTRSAVKETTCVVCRSTLPVFDEFPLVDGTFFLSPFRYVDDDTSAVVYDRRLLYLNSVCLGCLDGMKIRLLCRGCLAPWDGSSLVFGTMYSYDVFAAMSCCQGRRTCKACHLPIDDQTMIFFSDCSRLVRCQSCQTEDYHFVKPIRDAFLINAGSTYANRN